MIEKGPPLLVREMYRVSNNFDREQIFKDFEEKLENKGTFEVLRKFYGSSTDSLGNFLRISRESPGKLN